MEIQIRKLQRDLPKQRFYLEFSSTAYQTQKLRLGFLSLSLTRSNTFHQNSGPDRFSPALWSALWHQNHHRLQLWLRHASVGAIWKRHSGPFLFFTTTLQSRSMKIDHLDRPTNSINEFKKLNVQYVLTSVLPLKSNFTHAIDEA